MALNDDAYQPCTIIMQEALTTKGFVGKNFYANHGAVFNGQNMQNFLQQQQQQQQQQYFKY